MSQYTIGPQYINNPHEVGIVHGKKIFAISMNSSDTHYRLIRAKYKGIEFGGDVLCDAVYESNFVQIEGYLFIAKKSSGFGIISVAHGYTHIYADFVYSVLQLRLDGNIDANLDGKWGIIDKFGRVVEEFNSYMPIPGRQKVIDACSGKTGLLEGHKLVVPSVYDDIELTTNEDLCLVINTDSNQKKYGVFKLGQREIVTCKYIEISIDDNVITCLREKKTCQNGDYKIYDMYSFGGEFLTGGFNTVEFYKNGVKNFSYGNYVQEVDPKNQKQESVFFNSVNLIVDKNWNSVKSVNGYSFCLLGKNVTQTELIANNYDVNYYYSYETDNGVKNVIDVPKDYLCGEIETLYLEPELYEEQIIPFISDPDNKSFESNILWVDSLEISKEKFTSIDSISRIFDLYSKDSNINITDCIKSHIIVSQDDKYGIYDLKNKRISIPLEYDCIGLIDVDSVIGVKLVKFDFVYNQIFVDVYKCRNVVDQLVTNLYLGTYTDDQTAILENLLKEKMENDILEKNEITLNSEIILYPYIGLFDDTCEDDYYEDDFDLSWLPKSKYGFYNGFSDDVIDDVFEGDPEATWNVD